MDGAALEGLALRLVDGDGEGETQRYLREGADNIVFQFLHGLAVLADTLVDGGLHHLPLLRLDGNLTLGVIEQDRRAVSAGLDDRAERAVRQPVIRHVSEEHDPRALNQAQPVVRRLVGGLHVTIHARLICAGPSPVLLQVADALVVDGGRHPVRGTEPQNVLRRSLAVRD